MGKPIDILSFRRQQDRHLFALLDEAVAADGRSGHEIVRQILIESLSEQLREG